MGDNRKLMFATEPLARLSVGLFMAKILIADDSTVCRTVLSILLTNQGHEVAQAHDGREALAHLGRTTFDLVLLDHDMPHASGTAVLKRLREKSAIPAIVVSGTVSPQLAAEYKTLKVAEIYGKPVDPKTLRNKIHELLSGGAGAAAAKKAEVSAFDKELERVRNFPNTLTLLGGPDAPFAEIINRLVGDSTQALVNLPAEGGLEILEGLSKEYVIIIPSAAELSVSAQAALTTYVSKPHGRIILCVRSSIEELEEMGFSQTLLMRFGTRCLEIPDDVKV
jgi:CheY-like chemotaxis protein